MISLHKFVFHGLFIYLLVEVIAPKHSCKDDVKWNVDYIPKPTRGPKHLDIALTCKKKYQLIDIEVVAGRKLLDENVFVFGYTPQLITNINQCYWNQSCRITLPRDPMVTCVSIFNSTDSKGGIVKPNEEFSFASCFFQKVIFLRPVDTNCIKRKLVKSICELKKGKLVCTKKLPKRKGLIKSHNSFPWNYDETYRNLEWKCNIPLTDKTTKALVIGLKSVHVCDGDSLVLRTSKGELNITEMEDNTHLNFTKVEHGFVELEFIVAPDSKGCGGFLICYSEVKEKSLNRYGMDMRNVCDDLFNKRKKRPKLKTTGIVFTDW